MVKLFSPTSKYCQTSPTPSSGSPTTAAMLAADKPTFALSVRLLRILNVLIREFYSCLVNYKIIMISVLVNESWVISSVLLQVTQCEIFLSMLVKFLDSDKLMWQHTLVVEVLYSFCNQPDFLKVSHSTLKIDTNIELEDNLSIGMKYIGGGNSIITYIIMFMQLSILYHTSHVYLHY